MASRGFRKEIECECEIYALVVNSGLGESY